MVRRATDVLVAERARDWASSGASVRRQAPSTQASIAAELIHSKREARAAGRRLLEAEFETAFPLTLTAAELDAASSFVAAAGLTASWGSAALQAIAANSSLGKVPGVIAANVERTVATEVAKAFNEERNAILIDFGLGELDDERTGRPAKAAGMYKVWSALLDAKTCHRCFSADGETIELHKSFKAPGPPLHPRCRCIIEHIIVPKPERLEDIAIDYELFKQELKDVIRDGRAESRKHALGFVSDSLGEKRSAEVLAKRFHEERYATRISSGVGGGGGGSPPRGGGGSGGDEPPKFRRANPRQFRRAFEKAFDGSPYTHHVTHYSTGELRRMKCLLSEDGTVGVAVKKHRDGRVEATALFNQGGPKGAGVRLLTKVIDEHDVNYVECYAGHLDGLYARVGFVEHERFPFDRSLAPKSWNYERFGTPDYVTMHLGKP